MPLIEIGISEYYCDRRDFALISAGRRVLRRRDRLVNDGQLHERLLSGNPSTDSKMADAHHLDALVLRQLLTDGGLRDEGFTAHGTHEWQRELFRYLQYVDGVVATALPQIGSEG